MLFLTPLEATLRSKIREQHQCIENTILRDEIGPLEVLIGREPRSQD